MSHWYEDNSHSIGKTPLVRPNRITDGAPATLPAKIEGRNPAYSVKCRMGAAVAVAVRAAKQAEYTGKTIVIVFADSGERYLNSPLFDGLFDASGIAA